MRTFLTIFGIVIGITMVIIVLSAGEGLRGIIMGEISRFGDDWIDIEVKVPSAKKNSHENAMAFAAGVSVTTLSLGDERAIRQLDNVKNTYAMITTQAVVSYQNEKERPMIFAVSPSYIDVDKSEVERGRFFIDSEDRATAQVIVLGVELADNLFGNTDPLGKKIKVGSKSFEVIGVMEELGSTGFLNMDTLAYIPVRTAQKKLMGIDHILMIMAQVVDNTKTRATAEEVGYLLRERHNVRGPDKDDFAVTTMEEAIEMVGTIIFGVTWLLIALAAISLLVGGVGIMNVMYFSVAELSFEIGLRKAVGASSRAILMQFLVEAVIVTLLGGAVGMLAGIFISYIIALIAQFLGFQWIFSISLFSIFLGVSFSAAVGIIFGLYPAMQASKLDPIVSMRV